MPTPITLTLAHSPDPDDVFMWWPLTGMIDPADHDRIIQPPEIDTGDVRFRALPADIAVLNRRAIEHADLDITALSMFAWASVRDRYTLTNFGSSFGDDYGPKLVVRSSEAPPRRHTIAVPGVNTTAFLLLTMLLGQGSFDYVEMPFDRILDAVARAEQGTTAGLLIHQSQLTYADYHLDLHTDLGQWWKKHTGLPLPLGGNAVRSDLDARFGQGSEQSVVDLLHASLTHALAHRDRSTRYAMTFAPELSRAQADQYIDMYVSPLTIDAGDVGRLAITRLLAEGHRLGMCAAPAAIKILQPTGHR